MASRLFKVMIFLSLSLITTKTGLAQTEVNYQKLNFQLNEAFSKYEIAGISVGIVKDGEVFFQNGYGYRDIDEDKKIKPGTIFGIASLSKAFTVAAVAKLVDEKKLKWTDKVVDHIPEFKLNDPIITNLVTVEDLFSHRIGFETFDGDLLWYGTSYSFSDIISRIQHIPLTYDFRTTFGYQNNTFTIGGKIIENVTGGSWCEYLQTNFFEPLDMHSTFCSNQQIKPYLETAKPYINKKEISTLNYDNALPAAGINSCITDLNKWMLFWLNKGNYKGQQIISNTSVTNIFTPKINIPVSDSNIIGNHFKGYGLGWFVTDYKGKKVVYHSGGLPGYISKIVLVPEDNLGFTLLTNDMSSMPSALMYKILDDFIGLKETKWVDKFLKNEQKGTEWVDKMHLDKKLLKNKKDYPTIPNTALIGNYEDKMYGTCSIKGKGKSLTLTLNPTKEIFTSSLEHWYGNTYRIEFNDPMLPEGYVTFTADENNMSKSFVIDLFSQDFHFEKLNFIKQ